MIIGQPPGAGLLANANSVFSFAAAFGCRRPAKSRSVQINFVNNERLAASRSTTLKNPGSRVQSLSRLTLEKLKLGTLNFYLPKSLINAISGRKVV